MKKLKITLLIYLLVLFILPSNAYALDVFKINEYTTTLTVHENNTIDIVEIIEVEFSEPRHGIIYNIPREGYFERIINGEYREDEYYMKITDIQVENHKSKIQKNTDSIDVRIGDKDEYVDGKVTYNISYTFDIGDDGIDEMDDFYYDIIGKGWDVNINHVTIKIIMPKPFDAEKIGYYSGYNDSTHEVWFNHSIQDNTLLIDTTTFIPSGYGFTVRIELDEGYYVNERMPLDLNPYAIIISLATIIYVLYLFLKHGNDEKLFPQISFNPPDDITSAEVGYIIDGMVDNKDVTSLLLYWANMGYIEIEDCGDNTINLTKIKDLGSDHESYERYMFNKLFLISNTINTSSLQNSFYTTTTLVKSKIRKKYDDKSKKFLYTRKSRQTQVLSFMLMLIPVFLSIISSNVLLREDGIGAAMITLAIGYLLVFITLAITVNVWYSRKKSKNIVKVSFQIILLLILFVLSLSIANENVLISLLSTCLSFVIGLCAVFMRKRTDYSHRLLEQILGLKEFIINTEKDQINTLASEYPEYFYEVLPYAYVLGVSDKYSKLFESIHIQQPNWYTTTSTTAFSTYTFTRAISSNMNSIQSSITSSPPSSSSGGSSGSSGGGFSGGGSGGSSGSSW